MGKRITIQLVKCRRGCGRELATASRSIWGVSEAIRRKYQGICEGCLSDEERRVIWEAQVDAVRRKARTGKKMNLYIDIVRAGRKQNKKMKRKGDG